MKRSLFNFGLIGVSIIAMSLSGCKEGGLYPGSNPKLCYSSPLYDESSQTFSIKAYADSADDAALCFTLLANGDTISVSHNGTFNNIEPFEEGYNLMMEAQWKDTIIIRNSHIYGFVVPQSSIEKMSANELEKLINGCDETIRLSSNPHLVQNIELSVVDNKQSPPKVLSEVISFIKNETWSSVEVVQVEYEDNNRITKITIKPVGEKTIEVDDEEDLDF